MEMQINKDTIKKLRLEKSWSQEKLAEAARMNLRTMQRIEKDGVASLRSCESLASALGVEPQELRIGAERHTLPREPGAPVHQLVPALSIMAVLLMLWAVAQLGVAIWKLSPYESSVISFMLLFFAAFILLAFFTSIARKRFYILAGCVLLTTFVAPPEVFAQLKMGVPLVLLFEFSILLAKRFRAVEDSYSDTV